MRGRAARRKRWEITAAGGGARPSCAPGQTARGAGSGAAHGPGGLAVGGWRPRGPWARAAKRPGSLGAWDTGLLEERGKNLQEKPKKAGALSLMLMINLPGQRSALNIVGAQ